MSAGKGLPCVWAEILRADILYRKPGRAVWRTDDGARDVRAAVFDEVGTVFANETLENFLEKCPSCRLAKERSRPRGMSIMSLGEKGILRDPISVHGKQNTYIRAKAWINPVFALCASQKLFVNN